jgi:hypothetical protein
MWLADNDVDVIADDMDIDVAANMNIDVDTHMDVEVVVDIDVDMVAYMDDDDSWIYVYLTNRSVLGQCCTSMTGLGLKEPRPSMARKIYGPCRAGTLGRS